MTLPPRTRWYVALGVVLLLGLALRVRGFHDPILDHPGWRQGDTAAIARNFATLDPNPFHPQTDYDGPPPNYVELELQIVPYVASLGYRLFGIHESFGRIVSIAFSLGTVALSGALARRLFASDLAGIVAAFVFATDPGSAYYGRTFMPDTTMTFFLTAAVLASLRWIDAGGRVDRRFAVAAATTAAALLAKPVAIVALAPIVATLVARRGLRVTLRAPATYAFLALAILPYAAYDAYVRSIAEWHWASGITTLHVVPSLAASFRSLTAMHAKLALLRDAFGMLAATMLGPVGASAALVALVVPVTRAARTPLWTWLAAVVAYAFVVVTVERVDYYLYPFLPLAAVWTGGAAASLASVVLATTARRAVAVVVAAGLAIAHVVTGYRAVSPYYGFSKAVYVRAKALDAALAPGALVVMGHYDPSILYYIGRKGWEEDPYLWTPFDEQSAIRKGARYFIAVEPRRLARNVELAAWLARFPLLDARARWPVYVTDPAKTLPGAEARWRAFRTAERAHAARPALPVEPTDP